MQRLERSADFADVARAVAQSAVSNVWTAMPAIVQSVDFARQIITAQPAIQGVQTDKDGSTHNVNMPLLVDVPICYPKCAGFAITLPLQAGDEVLIIFASRCIDAWWQSGGTANAPLENRMCDLSDGFAILAPTSQPRRLQNVSATNIQMRSADGAVFIEIDPAGRVQIKAKELAANIDGNTTFSTGGDFSVSAGGGFTINAATITQTASTIALNGALTQNGAGAAASFTNGITAGGDVQAGGVSLQSHTHGGVQSGGANTSPPN